MPGAASGSTTRRKACQRLHPISQAASSSSTGMPMNRLEVISTAKGSARVAWTIASPRMESSMPTWMKMTASGSASSGIGKARDRMMIRRKAFMPGNTKRASAYPAGAPSTMAITIVKAAASSELPSALITPW